MLDCHAVLRLQVTWLVFKTPRVGTALPPSNTGINQVRTRLEPGSPRSKDNLYSMDNNHKTAIQPYHTVPFRVWMLAIIYL